MSFTDRTLQCFECGNIFKSPADEQEHFQSKGFFFEPKRCPACCQARRANRTIGTGNRRQVYSAVCAKCGIATEVPFEPRNGVPVYCIDCFTMVAQSRY